MSPRNALLLASLLAANLVFAGCIKLEEDTDGTATPSPTANPPAPVRMTAAEKEAETADLCPGGLMLPQPEVYCARKTIWLSGELEAAEFTVSLTTFNGNLDLVDSAPGTWNVTATLEARAASAAEARSRLNEIEFTWSHVEGSNHVLTAAAKQKPNHGTGLSAKMTAKFPSNVLLDYTGTTSNGGVTLDWSKADELVLTTSNGDITVNAEARAAVLTTSNGKINADLRPWASGSYVLTTSNGNVVLALPEDAQRGYDLEADTSNGEVKVMLKDGGLTRDKPTSKHFTTTNFGGRAIQTLAAVTSSNGNIDVNTA